MWSFKTVRDRSTDIGHDPRGLGRWSWMRFQGKQNVYTRVVSCYRPNTPNDKSDGGHSAWSQQQVSLDEQDIDTDPRQLFLDDITEAIRQWLAAGDHIVLGADLNEDVSSPAIRTTLIRAGLCSHLKK